MFTGIVTDIGTVEAVEERGGGDRRFRVACGYDPATIATGASICCAGACLTVVAFEGRDGGCWFDVDVSNETLSKSTLGAWQTGTRINLERALAMGDELGGHMTTGHVDGVAEILSREADGESRRFTFRAPRELAKFIAGKGSVALDGTSLTVNDVSGNDLSGAVFGINIIPHTLEVTTWGDRQAGDGVNLEIDMMARYVARLMDSRGDLSQ